MTETWDEYVIRRRKEGWRWGWLDNDQIKTDRLMLPPIGEPFARNHEPIEGDAPHVDAVPQEPAA
jgi:hypothetical protein